jgi:hypothetical protein
MSLFPLGILSAAGAGGEVSVLSDYELITSTILGSSQSSVTFDVSTYGSAYKHLQIRYTARSTRAAVADNLAVRFNGVTTDSYSHHRLLTEGSTVNSYSGSSAGYMLGDSTVGNTATTGAFSAGVIDILDPYSTSKNTTIRIFCGHAVSSANAIELVSGAFYNTAALTSTEIYALTGNLLAGSRFSIYGVK